MKKLNYFSVAVLFLLMLTMLSGCSQKLLPNEKILVYSPKGYKPPQADEKVEMSEQGYTIEINAVKNGEKRLLKKIGDANLADDGSIFWHRDGSEELTTNFWWGISREGALEKFNLKTGVLSVIDIKLGNDHYLAISPDEKYIVLTKMSPIMNGKYEVLMPYIYSLETGMVFKEFKPFEFLIKYYEDIDKTNTIKVHKKGECTGYAGVVNPDPCEPPMVAYTSGGAANIVYKLKNFEEFPAIAKGHINYTTLNFEVDFMEAWLLKMLDNPPKDGKLIISE